MWPRHLIFALWVVWALYWIVAAQSSKPVRQREPAATRLAFIGVGVLNAILLGWHVWPAWLNWQVIGGGWTRYWGAVAIIVLGLAFSIWARKALGDNWSGAVTLKEGHELVQSGPYRRLRHPIYTGVLMMLLGTGLAAGRVHGLLAFPLAFIAMTLKSRKEERFMTAEFGERYVAYRAHSWAMIPFVY